MVCRSSSFSNISCLCSSLQTKSWNFDTTNLLSQASLQETSLISLLLKLEGQRVGDVTRLRFSEQKPIFLFKMGLAHHFCHILALLELVGVEREQVNMFQVFQIHPPPPFNQPPLCEVFSSFVLIIFFLNSLICLP